MGRSKGINLNGNISQWGKLLSSMYGLGNQKGRDDIWGGGQNVFITIHEWAG